MPTFNLTNGADLFSSAGYANSGADTINALDGADTVYAGLGNDFVFGGNGVDIAYGEDGADALDGGAANDSLFGGSGNDTLTGGAGADSMDGGTGSNMASYATATGAVGVNLSSGTHTGDAAGDVFVNITSYRLSSFADSFTNNNTSQTAYGFAGSDTLNGGTAADIFLGGDDADSLSGNDGSDVLTGEAGADTLRGGNSNDNLTGGLGADVLDGGSGTDTVNYTAAAAAVFIDLESGAGLFGEAQGDTYTSIETFNLSNYADSFASDTVAHLARGLGGADSLNGNNGADTLDGGDGDDDLSGADGADSLIAGLGNDEIEGGEGTDTAVFSGSKFDWTVLRDGAALSISKDVGAAENDTVTGVEVLQFADGTYTIGGANNAPEALDQTVYIDIQFATSGGIYIYGSFGENDKAFDADGDALEFLLVGDNTGDDINLSYGAGYENDGAWILTFGAGLEVGIYDFTWQLYDGSAYSNFAQVNIEIYDSLA